MRIKLLCMCLLIVMFSLSGLNASILKQRRSLINKANEGIVARIAGKHLLVDES